MPSVARNYCCQQILNSEGLGERHLLLDTGLGTLWSLWPRAAISLCCLHFARFYHQSWRLVHEERCANVFIIALIIFRGKK